MRQTPDPVPGIGQLLLRPISAAMCASDVHYMDHPDNPAPRFVYDADRDTVMGPDALDQVRKSQGPPRIVVHLGS